MNSTILTWIITGISVAGTVVTFVIHYDINIGTIFAQQIADWLAGDGYSVTVVTPPGAPQIFAAPEIDAASGINAIALLTGVLLLADERARFKHSSKSDE